MNFVHPILAIAGISAVAIPIAIHLLMRRKHRPIAWGAMAFLLEAYRQQRRRLQMEQLLLLLIRCLLVLLVGLAVARPMIKSLGTESSANVDVYILLDNSLTSQTVDPDTGATALAQHIETAQELLQSMEARTGASHRAALVLLGGPASAPFLPPSSSIAELRSRIAHTRATESRVDLDGAIQIVRSSVLDTPDTDVMVVLLSEFREGSFRPQQELAQLKHDIGTEQHMTIVALEPDQSARANSAIESVEFVRTNPAISSDAESGAHVRVTARRFGPTVREAASATVRASNEPLTDDRSRDGVNVDWQPGETSATILVPVEQSDAGQSGLVFVDIASAGDTIAADNAAQMVVPKVDSLQIGLVTPRTLPGTNATFDPDNPADWLRIALEPMEQRASPPETMRVRILEPGSLESAFVQTFDAVIIPDPGLLSVNDWEGLRSFVAEHRGVVVVMPSSAGGAQLWTDAFDREFATGWTIGREPVAAAHTLAKALVQDSIGQRLLSVLIPEFETLSAPVHVSQYLEMRVPDRDIVLALDNDLPLITAKIISNNIDNQSAQSGMVVLFAVPISLAWTDLPGRPMFVPLLHELLQQSVTTVSTDQPFIAGQQVAVDRVIREIEPVDPSNAVEFAQSGTAAILRYAGVYTKRDAAGEPVGTVVVQSDTTASNTNAGSSEQIIEAVAPLADEFIWLQHAGETVLESQTGSVAPSLLFAAGSRGRAVWRWLIILGLVFAVIELVLARLTSHAGKSRTQYAMTINPS